MNLIKMNEIGNKRLYKHMTEPVFNKKGGPIKQIIIKKYGTKKNNISQNEKNKNNNSKIKEKSLLNKSAILNRFEHEEISKTKNNINSKSFIRNPEGKLKYNSIFNTTIIKPTIVQQSILKPIIMPVNIRTSGNLNDEFFIQKILNNNSQTNIIQKDKQIQKSAQIYKKKNIKNYNENIDLKENINPNSLGNNIKRKVIIQKNIKHKNDNMNKEKDKGKNILLINPQPKDKDTLIIQKLDKNNSLKLKIANRTKFKTFQPKIKDENILNKTTKNEIKDNSINKNSIQINDLRKSMKPIEKINNITVNNTLKQTYKEMIKCKTIIVGLNSQIKINKEAGPRDSIRFKDN